MTEHEKESASSDEQLSHDLARIRELMARSSFGASGPAAVAADADPETVALALRRTRTLRAEQHAVLLDFYEAVDPGAELYEFGRPALFAAGPTAGSTENLPLAEDLPPESRLFEIRVAS